MRVNIEDPTKSVMTVAETARLVGLSRARFYQLQGTAFPLPVYDIISRRPIYTEEQQRICLEVRRRNCGIDGRPVLFYSRRPGNQVTARRTVKKATATKTTCECDPDVLDGVRALGQQSATSAQVAQAMRTLFPGGISAVDCGDVIRAVFMRLRQNKGDSVGR
jgi:hypothetical protein